MFRTTSVFLGVAVLLTLAASEPSAGQTIREFALPSGGHPLAIAPGPGGMWFTVDQAAKIGSITPGGTITEFPIHHPARGIVAGPDGNLWLTSDGFLSRMTPAGEVTDFPISGAAWGITVGLDGALWFTEIQFDSNPAGIAYGILGRSTVEGETTETLINSWAEDIATDPDGSFWVPDWTETGNDAVTRVRQTGAETRHEIPAQYGLHAPGDAGPSAVALGSDGSVWFAQARIPYIGRLRPSGEISEFQVSDATRDVAIAFDGSVWFTEPGNNRIGRMTNGGSPVEMEAPTQSAQPWGIGVGADGNVWFTEHGAGRIGKVELVASPDARSLYLGGNRFVVTATWISPNGSGDAHGVPMTSDTGYFWFTDAANVELVVKVLDGCGVNNHRWVFAGGLTNDNVVLTVTDSQTQQSHQYVNAQGTAFQPVQDTGTFPCP